MGICLSNDKEEPIPTKQIEPEYTVKKIEAPSFSSTNFENLQEVDEVEQMVDITDE
jgi:hypothetical protein